MNHEALLEAVLVGDAENFGKLIPTMSTSDIYIAAGMLSLRYYLMHGKIPKIKGALG